MHRDVPQPVHARRLERHARIEPARHRLVDDRLLLLLQQRDHAALGGDVAADASVGDVEEVGDGLLLGEGWEYCLQLCDSLHSQAWLGRRIRILIQVHSAQQPVKPSNIDLQTKRNDNCVFGSPKSSGHSVNISTKSTLPTYENVVSIMGKGSRISSNPIPSIDRVTSNLINTKTGNAIAALHLSESFQLLQLPMGRHISKPLDLYSG